MKCTCKWMWRRVRAVKQRVVLDLVSPKFNHLNHLLLNSCPSTAEYKQQALQKHDDGALIWCLAAVGCAGAAPAHIHQGAHCARYHGSQQHLVRISSSGALSNPVDAEHMRARPCFHAGGALHAPWHHRDERIPEQEPLQKLGLQRSFAVSGHR